jgi:hypothetical protein
MTDPVNPELADLAAGQILAGLIPVFGLHADADRVALLRPLAASLLRQGASLTATIDSSLEPLEMGGVPRDTMGAAR